MPLRETAGDQNNLEDDEDGDVVVRAPKRVKTNGVIRERIWTQYQRGIEYRTATRPSIEQQPTH